MLFRVCLFPTCQTKLLMFVSLRLPTTRLTHEVRVYISTFWLVCFPYWSIRSQELFYWNLKKFCVFVSNQPTFFSEECKSLFATVICNLLSVISDANSTQSHYCTSQNSEGSRLASLPTSIARVLLTVIDEEACLIVSRELRPITWRVFSIGSLILLSKRSGCTLPDQVKVTLKTNPLVSQITVVSNAMKLYRINPKMTTLAILRLFYRDLSMTLVFYFDWTRFAECAACANHGFSVSVWLACEAAPTNLWLLFRGLSLFLVSS